MRIHGCVVAALLLAICAPLSAQRIRTAGLDSGGGSIQDNSELLEDSREAGLLTDWHMEGHYGKRAADFSRHFAPERVAKSAAGSAKHQEKRRYELVFADGTFTLPPALTAFKGVFYAQSSTYLYSSGEWNVYLESGAEAVVFFDGRPVIERDPKAGGTLRGTVHAESGYHDVIVKFVAQAAPFRVAILPPNSGSRRKNNTPYLDSSPTSEDLMARLHLDGGPASGN